MKFKTIFASLAAFCLLAIGCTEALNTGDWAEIQVKSSYINLDEKGSTNYVAFAASDSWEVVNIPEWLEVKPTSGPAGEDNIVYFSSDAAKEDRSATIKIVCAGKEQILVVSQPGDPALRPQYPEFTAGDYWIMFNDNGTWLVSKPVGASAGYGWLYADNAINKDGVLSHTAATVFTFTAVEGGFTIQDGSGRYYHMPSTYDSFNLIAERQTDLSDVWTVQQTGKEEFTIVNALQGKTMQYDPAYSSAGAYAAVEEKKYKPFLVKAEAPAPELIAIPTLSYSLEKEAGELNVEATVNCTNLLVETGVEWLAYKGVAEVEGKTVLSFNYYANEFGARAAKVKVTASADGQDAVVEFDVTQAGAIVDATAAEINAVEDGATIYRVTGLVSNVANTTFGNYDIIDYTGKVYVYGTLDAAGATKNFLSLGIKAGDIVTVSGPKTSYNNNPQLKNVTVENHISVSEVSAAEFLAKEVNPDVYYMLTGVVTNLKDGDKYGNFDLVDESGSAYVYGVVSGWGGPKKLFQDLGVKNGDTITIVGVRSEHNGNAQVGSAFYVSHTRSADL